MLILKILNKKINKRLYIYEKNISEKIESQYGTIFPGYMEFHSRWSSSQAGGIVFLFPERF